MLNSSEEPARRRSPWMRRVCFLLLVLVGFALLGGMLPPSLWEGVRSGSLFSQAGDAPDTPGGRIAVAAMSQIDKTVSYDPAYVKLDYPMGDVPIETGVCTDVVIRALREAVGFDLQQRVHEDMRSAFREYPNRWGLTKPDPNIDHRRVPNLQVYFERAGYALPVTADPEDYQPGDVVTCRFDSGRDHIMVVGYQKNWKGDPLTIHNAGGGTGQNDCLFRYELTGHYRVR